MQQSTKHLFKFLGCLSAAGLITACDSSSPGISFPDNLSVLVANNPGVSGNPDLVKGDGEFNNAQTVFAPNANEGITFDLTGNLHQNSDGGSGAGISTVCKINTSARNNGTFSNQRDRRISAANSGLQSPKGLALANKAGRLIAADVGAGTIVVLSNTVSGDATPVATTTLPGTNAWDVAYDEGNDRLFAALTNGTLAVFDNYLGNDPANASADRIIIPAGGVNLHGIALSDNGQTAVLSDVGSATVDDDGKIFVLKNVDTASGAVTPFRTIAGPDTQLGNPVDIALRGDTLYVAEKAQSKVLIYLNIFLETSGNIAPARVIDQTGARPESVAFVDEPLNLPAGVSDLDSTTALSNIAVTLNPGAPAANPTPLTPDPAGLGQTTLLSAGATPVETGVFTADRQHALESITIDINGDAYISFDDGSTTNNSGILVTNRLKNRAGTAEDLTTLDRIIQGASTGLTSPKGMDISDEAGLIFVADVGADNIKAYSTCATGDVAPLFTTGDLGTATKAWDVDYDPINDRLFAAGTNGNVLVYDNYVATSGVNGPSREIIPAITGAKASANLHGIVHVESTDQLILTDVGPITAGANNDGQVFVINNASTANGNTNVNAQIGGSSTALGNPVDAAFDGKDLYIAEKTNDQLLIYRNILNHTGSNNIAADTSVPRTKPESVVLLPTYLSGQ